MPYESVNIKGVEIPLHKEHNEKIQDFVKKTLHLMFDNELIPDSEINNMLNKGDKRYCNETFGIGFPIIQNDKNKLTDNAGHSRYYSREIFGDEYYVCSQWGKNKEQIYQSKLADWIKKINSLN
jgi:hypothetical protein